MQVFSDVFAFLSGTPALVGLALTAVVILLTSNWRLSLLALLAQYVLVGIVLTQSIRIEVALVKILLGIMAVAILHLSALRLWESTVRAGGAEEEAEASGPHFLGLHMGWMSGPLGFPLRLLAVLLVLLAVVRLFESYQLPLVAMDVAVVACWLAGMGMMGLILSGDSLRAATAVLTILTGFDLVFSSLEPSLAMVGFFGAFVLAAALAFSYLIVVHIPAAGGPPARSGGPPLPQTKAGPGETKP